MEFDVRSGNYTFKHSLTPIPDMDETRFKEHYHTMYELLYFIKGDASFRVKDTTYSLKSGDLLVVQPGEHHNLILRSQSPYERMVLRFDPVDVNPALRRYLPSLDSVYFIQNTPLSAEFSHLDSHYSSVRKDMILSTFISSLNIILAYLVSSDELIQQADLVNKDIKPIIDYISNHLADIQSIDDLSNALHLSKSSIYKIFHKQFDTPIMSYIRTQKIMLARTMLNEGTPATEVAIRLGFIHYSSFYRDYYKVFKETPSGKNKD